MLVGALAGRAAEEIVFDTVTTGASNDIEKGDEDCPCHDHTIWYVGEVRSDRLESCQHSYLDGRAGHATADMQTAAEIDSEVMKMLKDAYEEAKRSCGEITDSHWIGLPHS